MLDTTESLQPITLPIDESDRHQANTFASQQPNDGKAEQVYRNTLAVLATQKYLQLLGIETTLNDSQCWHPLHRVLSNVADLVLPQVDHRPAHYLDCRAIREGDRTCHIPESAWQPDPEETDRPQLMGHVIVQLNKPYDSAHILGFAHRVVTSSLPLETLPPVTSLIEHLLAEPQPAPNPVVSPSPALTSASTSISSKAVPHPTEALTVPAEPLLSPATTSQPLHQWLDGKITQSWEQLTTELAERWSMLQGTTLTPAMDMRSVATPTPTLADHLHQRIETLYSQELGTTKMPTDYADALAQLIQTTQNDETRWQASELLWSLDPQHPYSPVITLKDLGLYLNQHTVALMVGLFVKEDGSLLVLTRLCPIADATVLPAGLMMVGCNEQNEQFFQVEARQRDQYIQFKFTAEKGDRFTLKVMLQDSEFTESFVV